MVSNVWLGLLLATAVFAEITEDGGVWVLTDENFQDALSLQPDLLVEFYAPWCGHCKKLAPEYEKAAQRLKNNNPPIRIAKVDATLNKNLASKYKIESYPTLKYFVNKNPNDYDGGRTEDTIVNWLVKKNSPSMVVITEAEELEKFITARGVVAVLFAVKDSAESAEMLDVSKTIDSVSFAVSTSDESASKYSVTKPALVLFKNFDDKRVDYTGKLTKGDISKFVNENRLPWIIPFGEEAIDLIFKKNNPALFIFSKSIAEYQHDAETLSKEVKGTLLISHTDLRSGQFANLGDYLGVSADSQPIVVIVDGRNNFIKYKSTETISLESLRSFVSKWKNNQLEAYYKSQEVPAQSHENGVRIVVGKNFNEVVLDNTKDVLIEFYAPWCGHCKKLAPEYEKLAGELKENRSIIIAKMDSTQNEVKDVNIKSYPTLKFYPANNKNPIDYKGDRTFEELLKFVLEKATPNLDTAGKVEL